MKFFLKLILVSSFVFQFLACSKKINENEQDANKDVEVNNVDLSGTYVGKDETYLSIESNRKFRKTEILTLTQKGASYVCTFDFKGVVLLFERAKENREKLLKVATHYLSLTATDSDYLKKDGQSPIHQKTCEDYAKALAKKSVKYYISINNNELSMYNNSQTDSKDLKESSFVSMVKR